MIFSGRPNEITRRFGKIDVQDPTEVPLGLAAEARNCDFNLTSVMTRAGVNLTANGVAAGIQGLYKTPVTGLMGMIYSPESSAQSFYQLPLLYQDNEDHTAGSLQAEVNVGSGVTQEIISSLLQLPARSHLIGSQAYNRAYMAFSDLTTPTANAAVLSLETFKYGGANGIPPAADALDPYGMKPYGWSWLPNTAMLIGEVGTPTQKNVNHHTYQISAVTGNAQTGATEPAWPLATGATVVDGNVTWKEITPSFSIVYQCYPPSPTWTTNPAGSGGNWPVDGNGNAAWIYFAFTYVTAAGETDIAKAFIGTETPSGSFYSGGPPETGSQSYTLTCPAPAAPPAGFPGDVPTGWNLYIALSASGTQGLPDPSAYQKWNPLPLTFGALQTVLGPATGAQPPSTNNANIVGAGNCDAAEALSDAILVQGLNTTGAEGIGAQYEFGIRYAAIMFVNRNGSVSGFTQNSAVPVQIFYNGSTLLGKNIPAGPPNTIARIVSFTELQFDAVAPGTLPQYPLGERHVPLSIGTSAGPYFYIGDWVFGPDQFIFPQTTQSDNFSESATVIGDNTTTGAYFSYTEPYLIASNDVTDRLQVIWPYPCVDLYYSPTTDRIIQTGVPGFNGHWVSLAADPESYYGADVSFIPNQNASGERAICAREFRGVLYSLWERSGHVMIPDDASPSGWDVRQRWDKEGPCGPRAVDVCGRFMIFVHRSGVYRYSQEEPEPVKVSKELKYWWQTINWEAEETIWCKIDEEKHAVRIGVPVGQSTVPDQEILIYFEEGLGMPIHFSTFKGSEISMDQARRISIQDTCAFVGARIERAIPPAGPFDQGAAGILFLDSSFYTSQFLYGSSGPDGAVMAITPGIWHDGEGGTGPASGIDWQYETVCPTSMMMLCKFEGFNLNARGSGSIQTYAIAGRTMITDWNSDGSPGARSNILKMRPIDLVPNQSIGISRWGPAKINERWRLGFNNGKVPDVWAELKYICLFEIPWSSARSESQS